MFSLYLTKFLAVFALVPLFFSGCGLGQKTKEANTSVAPAEADALSSAIPFATKEPEIYQAQIVVTANGAERKTFVARSGANHRYDFNFGEANQLTSLQTDKNYLLLPARKIYAENVGAPAASSDDWSDFLTTESLAEKPDATFEKLETVENITKYRVSTGGGSEILIQLDEDTGLPVRQEFFSIAGEQKVSTFVFELKNLKLEAGAELFAIPADFKKISIEEFRKLQRGTD